MSKALVRRLRLPSRHHSTATHESITRSLRALLRTTAQPVAVVTSFMPEDNHSPDALYHGATLSSFTSVSMDPHPLVAFALRIPSRMATSLKAAHPAQPSHMVINLLSSEQSHVAVAFSRPDLHTHPFTAVSYTLSEDGLPVIGGSLGAMSCKLVSAAIPLHDLDYLERRSHGNDIPEQVQARQGVASELFVARVTRVEKVDAGGSRTSKQPLLYYQRHYTTVSPISQRTLS